MKKTLLSLFALLSATVGGALAQTPELVTPPESAEVQTWYTQDGYFFIEQADEWVDYTIGKPSVNVVIDGTDIYIQGLAYWFEDAWIKGTIDGANITFPNGQYIGTDEYGDEYMIGSDDAETVTDIIFALDSEKGELVAMTNFIAESEDPDEVYVYTYWYQPVFSLTAPEEQALVELPDGAEVATYVMQYKEEEGDEDLKYKAVFVAVVGNDVYFQGISEYNPDAWVKGTLEGNTVTFRANQFTGFFYNIFECFAFFDSDAIFTYDPETEGYSAQGHIFGTIDGEAEDGSYYDPVLIKVADVAATPANPIIDEFEYDSYFGASIEFSIQLIDTEGNILNPTKLYYQFWVEENGEVSLLTFTPDTHKYLDEEMTAIPYTFSDDYDIYNYYVYFNDLYSEDWDKVGIQLIYLGGGEEHKSEVIWWTIEKEVTGIGSLEAGSLRNATIYNLSGQRVQKAGNGLYVVNGRKAYLR